MTFKNQFKKIKENWLLLVLVLVVVIFFSAGNPVNQLTKVAYGSVESAAFDEGFAGGIARSAPQALNSYYDGDFAPDVEERIITKNAYMEVEVERGDFKQKETELKNIVSSTDSILISENSNIYGRNSYSYYSGNYQIKVEAQKADALISQLKNLGEVLSVNENTQDITGSYLSLQDQLTTEKARLARFQQLFNEVKDVNEKISLTDRIFQQERTIKYLEDALKNQDRRVDYTTVNVQLTEERSSYAGIAVVKFSELVRKLVSSFNGLISLIVYLLPYAILALLIWIVVRFVRR